jgi:hypothetical protein
MAVSIESGSGPFDLKPLILDNGKPAKVSKKGARYKTIPFDWATKNNSNFTPVLPASIYRSILRNGSTYRISNIPDPYRDIVTKNVTSAGGESSQYKHKSPIHQGISQNRKGDYSSFRTVSSNSAMNSWIHPGFEARNFMNRAFDGVDFAEIVNEELSNYVNAKISEISSSQLIK